ncbi:MAG TPA: hypothetical protein VKD65_10400 [Candidatus Angelobacter sp.]|nr:hypothetical protein [Candidatus Angelobacter sp.]
MSDEPYGVTIIFDDNGSEGLLVTSLGNNLYRLEETSFLGEARYHDIIEAEIQGDGSLRFVGVVTPSALKTSSLFLGKELIESPRLSAFLEKVMAVGGNWEKLFESFLILHLPADQESSLLPEFNTLVSDLTRRASQS